MRTGARGLGRLFQGKRYLYELPWYITLGSKASGKTSAILQAGLSLPVADQMHRSARAWRIGCVHATASTVVTSIMRVVSVSRSIAP